MILNAEIALARRASGFRSGAGMLLVAMAFAGCATTTARPDQPATLVIMGTTDVHAWLLPWDFEAARATSNGLALLAPLVDSIRGVHGDATLLVDSGDLLQGSSMAAAYTPLEAGEEHPVITAMNLMEYDAAALGNHEFNFGIEHLDRVIADATFPFLSANVVHAGTGEPAYPEYVLVTRMLGDRPLTVGVTGVLPPGVAVWDRDHVQGRLEFPDMVDRLRVVVPRMRAEGADVVVVAAHSGFEGTSYDAATTGLGAENRMADAAREVPGIDVVFLGHTHRELADSVINDVLFLQAGARAASLAVATLELRSGRDGWTVTSRRGELVRPSADRADPAMVAALADAHARTQARAERVIGMSPVEWSAREARVRDTPLLDFINAVQKRVSGAQLSAAAAFSLNAGLPAGDITAGHLARIYPYDNNLLRAVRISGADLRAYLEHSARYFLPCPDGDACERRINPDWPGYNFDVISGVEYVLDLTRPMGERVTRLEFEGVPVRDDQMFTLALNNYRQGGGGGFPGVVDAEVVYDGTESIRSLLIQEIEERGVIRPEDYFTPSWSIRPE
jgi:2',3'-cyclic-nucleotide 2'-phosphodiesterase (5'-nucleotidase family)